MAYHILVVDDEKLIVKGIKFSLEQDGMEVTAAYDGEEALQYIKEGNYDLVVLDVMLPKMDGLQVCQQVREFSQIPIIMVTAKGEDMDKIMGLEYGADDYITKPFNILELKARIKAILRRSVKKVTAEPQTKNVLKARDLELAYDSRRVFINGKEVNLTGWNCSWKIPVRFTAVKNCWIPYGDMIIPAMCAQWMYMCVACAKK